MQEALSCIDFFLFKKISNNLNMVCNGKSLVKYLSDVFIVEDELFSPISPFLSVTYILCMQSCLIKCI